MADQYILGSIFASILGIVLVYVLFVKKNGRRSSIDGGETTGTTTIAAADSRECRSRDDEVDVIIVGAGVAGAALAHTLGKVLFVPHLSL